MKARYAAGPTAIVYKDENGKKSNKKLIQLLWGDLIDLLEEPTGNFAKVKVRIDEGTKMYEGWMKKSEIPWRIAEHRAHLAVMSPTQED
jgi:hypothetical protein